MKRKLALQHIKVAGYHGDVKGGMRIYIENRISREAYNNAWLAGERAKQNGTGCNCPACNPTKEAQS